VALKWEKLNDEFPRGYTHKTWRAKIPLGWLVRDSCSGGGGSHGGVTFVPDPNHQWDGNSLD